MPRDVSGTFTLPQGTLVASGDVVRVDQHNPAMLDLAAGITKSLARDGRGGMTGPLNMAGNAITGMVDGLLPTDAATVGQIVRAKGDPGGNVMAVGDFTTLPDITIPIGTTLAQTSGYTRGIVNEDTSMTDADVAAQPHAIVKTANNRYFRRDQRTLDLKAMGAGRGNDDYPLFMEALDYLRRYSTGSPAVYFPGTPRLRIPSGMYHLSQTVSIKQSLVIEGDAGLFEGGEGTVFQCQQGLFAIDRSDTVRGVQVPNATFGGDGACITGVVGRYIGSEAKSANGTPGVTLKARSRWDRVAVWGFPGDGFRINAQSGLTGEDHGNANLFRMYDCMAYNCWNGLHARGGDANAGACYGFNAYQNVASGILDESVLGNNFHSPHLAGNGQGYGSIRTMATYNGNRYSVVPGREAQASTTVPGTDATVWLFIEAGGAIANLIVPWQSGMTWLGAVAMGMMNDNARGSFSGNPYSEGTQPASYLASRASAIGGISNFQGPGVWFNFDMGRVYLNGLQAGGVRLNGNASAIQMIANDSASSIDISVSGPDTVISESGVPIAAFVSSRSTRFAGQGPVFDVAEIGLGFGVGRLRAVTSIPTDKPKGPTQAINAARTAANQPAGWTNDGSGTTWIPYGASA